MTIEAWGLIALLVGHRHRGGGGGTLSFTGMVAGVGIVVAVIAAVLILGWFLERRGR